VRSIIVDLSGCHVCLFTSVVDFVTFDGSLLSVSHGQPLCLTVLCFTVLACSFFLIFIILYLYCLKPVVLYFIVSAAPSVRIKTLISRVFGFRKFSAFHFIEEYDPMCALCGYVCIYRRPCIPKRRSMTVVCRVPSSPSYIYRSRTVHTASGETFFQRTVPRFPLSFTIDPNWSSELIVNRRVERQKRREDCRSLPPRYHRNFSFVY